MKLKGEDRGDQALFSLRGGSISISFTEIQLTVLLVPLQTTRDGTLDLELGRFHVSFIPKPIEDFLQILGDACIAMCGNRANNSFSWWFCHV